MRVPWRSSVIVKFFLSYFGVTVVLFTFFYFYSAAIVKNFYIASLSRKMQEETRVLSRLLPREQRGKALDKICRDLAQDLKVRLTVIALDGTVLGDSDESSGTMENHATRPEVIRALSRGMGSSIRYSTTVGYEMLYQALRKDGRVIRVSVPLEAVEEVLDSIREAILLGLLLASGLGLGLAFVFSRRLGWRVRRMAQFSQRVAQGSFLPEISPPRGSDELSVLENNLSEISHSIREKIQEITAEKEKAESILRGMMEGVLVVDTQGRVILLNENAQKIFNLPSIQNLQGASFMEISRHPEMRELIEEVIARLGASEYFTREISLDDRRFLRVNAVSLRDGKNGSLGYILVFHDITQLRRLEHMRADFVANVSHELRTPLTAIRGYAETLLQTPPDKSIDSEQFLGIIYRHSERLGRLIDDLLTLSDLETGRAQLTKENVDTTDLISRVLELFRDQAEKKRIALTQIIEPDIPPVLGDPDRLQQILINLIDNAVKYTPAKGRVKVTASLATSLDNRESPMVEIAVADTGCGIPEDDLPRLTERFYRVDKARSRELGGTGLGLAIVKHIVQAHGGSLKVQSQVQKGTTVRVRLPQGQRTRDVSEVPFARR